VCRDWLFWLLVWKRWFCRVYRDWWFGNWCGKKVFL
jgi:hypothetical protein